MVKTKKKPEPSTDGAPERRPWATSVRVPIEGAYDLGPKARLMLWPPLFEVVVALGIVTRLRDRKRCPRCEAVGTFKPHGGAVDTWVAQWHGETVIRRERKHGEIGIREARRWLCKFCGYYIGAEGVIQAFVDRDRGWWALPFPFDPDSPEVATESPADILYREAGKVWPWRG